MEQPISKRPSPLRAVCCAIASLLMAPMASAATFQIELDYMVETGPGAHSHMPSAAEIATVVQMFACQGHTLIVQVDDALPHHDLLQLDPNNSNNFFGYSGEPDSYGALKSTWYDHAGQSGWHYCIFGHRYETKDLQGNYIPSGSSGLGEILGDDFIVTMGGFLGEVGSPFDRASTLAHEFGHNLGLGHCGSGDCEFVGDGMPNLPSIMSYSYQLEGVRSGMVCNGLVPTEVAGLFKEMDYSGGRMCSLWEALLDEPLGTTMTAVDWDCSGGVSGFVAHDLSTSGAGWCDDAGFIGVIDDLNEWASIQDVTAFKPAASLEILPMASCITAEEVAEMRSMKAFCAQPTAATEACVSAKALFVTAGASPGGADGRCQSPYPTVAGANAAATNGSALFLRPGTYDETGVVTLSKPMWIYAVKSALIR